MSQIIYKEESYKIIGACFEVYNEMECGFLEPVYQECVEIELQYQRLPFTSQRELSLTYRNRVLEQKYKPDFICYDKIILELKSVSEITNDHRAQVMNYVHATNLSLGLLVNFGAYPKLEYERFVLTEHPKRRKHLD